MDISKSECSSGCESGWTVYFDQFSCSSYQYNRIYSMNDEEHEDLSMISDASSAPPPLHDEKNRLFQPPEPMKSNQKEEKEQNSHLEDTATSPVLNFYKHASVFSQGLSTTNVEVISISNYSDNNNVGGNGR